MASGFRRILLIGFTVQSFIELQVIHRGELIFKL